MRTHFRGLKWGFDGSPIEFLVENGRVLERGNELSGDEVVDLDGQWILPGFVDCHCHILPTGLDMQKLELRGVSSKSEMEAMVRSRCPNLNDSEWLLAVHYDANLFEDGKDVSASELETWTDGRPAILRHTSGHSCITNLAGLKLANIDESTKDPQGGRIVRNENGIETGLLEESAMALVYRAAPKPTVEQMADAIFEAAKSMSAFGITCASDMMTGQHGLEKEIAAYQMAIEKGAPIRIRLYVEWHKYFRNPELMEFRQTEKLKIAGLKLFCDGAIGSGTAGVYEEFESGGFGIMNYPSDELIEMVARAHSAGFQMAIHAIGDKAVDWVMDAYERTGEPDKHRLEHAMILSDLQIERIAKAKTPVTMQPEFLSSFGHAYRRRLGDKRASKLKRLRSLLDRNVLVGLSSDRPIVEGDPWTGIRAASQRPDGFEAGESIEIKEAIALYTSGAAKVGNDFDFGDLTPGQWADFQIYERDPLSGFEAPVATYLAGIKVL